MRTQYLAPAISAALNALDEKAERAAAERDAFRSEVTPGGAKLVKKPDGSWVVLLPDPKPQEGGNATP